MPQIDIARIIQQADRLGVEAKAGPVSGTTASRVEIAEIGGLDQIAVDTLVIVNVLRPPSSYRLDIAIRRASALQLAGLIFPTSLDLSITSVDLAERGGVPVLQAPGAKASNLAVAIDRLLGSGASDTVTQAQFAIERTRELARQSLGSSVDTILSATDEALGGRVWLEDDMQVAWTEDFAVFVGDAPRGRLRFEPAPQEAENGSDAANLALPVVASMLSRFMQRDAHNRFASQQTSAEFLSQLVLTEASHIEAFAGQAHRIGFPLQLSHVVAWFKFTRPGEEFARLPRTLKSALELHALELFEFRDEICHIAYAHDDAFIVLSERLTIANQQKRLHEVAANVADYAQALSSNEITVTVGLGTPQIAGIGLRQSAAEAKLAAEAAVISGRVGRIATADVTGLRRVLLEFYASPTSRELLTDILRPLSAQGPKKAEIAVQTLLAYLRNRCSPTKAAVDLMLHPNAVTYRIRNIQRTLNLDLKDPDIRFAVELACRVRQLGTDSD